MDFLSIARPGMPPASSRIRLGSHGKGPGREVILPDPLPNGMLAG